jgi:ubiquinone/menaquinone biosynthesis C-methylase UbiE
VRVAAAETIARSEGFLELRERIISLADPRPEDTVVDIGSGTGLLSLVFAERSRRVWAIDSSRPMGDYLKVKAASAGLANVETVLASAVSLPLVDEIADIVVSNYCMHELRDAEKLQALAEARRVLRPGGRLVVGDMMFSLGGSDGRDRQVVIAKFRALAAMGLPGLWRLAKNAGRLARGAWEHPANEAWWREALAQSGFEGIEIEIFKHEGGIAAARTPSVAIVLGPSG